LAQAVLIAKPSSAANIKNEERARDHPKEIPDQQPQHHQEGDRSQLDHPDSDPKRECTYFGAYPSPRKCTRRGEGKRTRHGQGQRTGIREGGSAQKGHVVHCKAGFQD
jgi:hypothetical protein